jgi:uncharacterized protein (DUF1501 family)
MNRRDFIKSSSCAAMGSTTLLNTLANLKMMNGAVNQSAYGPNSFGDYKALVCILLSGGIDSYNVLIPRGTTVGGDNGHAEYVALRTDLAIQSATNVRQLNYIDPNYANTWTGFRGINTAYKSFGVHTNMPEVQSLFNSGKLAFMANIGTLVQPILNRTEYSSGLKKIPLGLYSHSDQQTQWQSSVPQSRDALGFGGRVADLLNASNANQAVSMNISLAGRNTFQRGADITEYAISRDLSANNVGFESLPSWWGNSGLLNQLRDEAIDNMVAKTYANLLQKTYSTTTQKTIAAFDIFKDALTKVPTFTTTVPNTDLARDLAAAARMMSVRNFVGVKRQIFFIEYGGWDMHDNLVNGMNGRLPTVDGALKAFYDMTVELGIADKVTTFTISDFARTATSNGLGSDHAWGGNSMVMGGAVRGGRIFGAFPKMSVANSNPANVSFRGNFIPAISTDELYAELALWYGVSPSDLCYALPNLGNFYSYSAGNYPIGVMDFNNSPISTDNRPQGCLTY